MHFQLFPEEVRPATLITHDRKEIRSFAEEHDGDIIIKPLQGSGGQGVFRICKNDLDCLNQIIETVASNGYIIAQEYLPGTVTRLFMMNGEPLRYKGRYAAFCRLRNDDDLRGNVRNKGKKAKVEIDSRALRIAEIIRPKLVADGIFIAGLDIVDNKLVEINLFSPSGLISAQSFENVNFSVAVIEAIEQKVQYVGFYQRNFSNVDMATL
jgi:glutathione synthase